MRSLQGGDDAAQVGVHGGGGPVGVAGGDGVDDLQVFAERGARPFLALGEAETLAHQLTVVPIEQLGRDRLVTEVTDRLVRANIQAGAGRCVAGCDIGLHRGADRSELGRSLRGDPPGGFRREQALQLHTHLGDVDGLLDRDDAHPRSAIGHSLDEAF